MDVRPASPADAEAVHRTFVAACRAAYGDALEDDAFVETVDVPSRVEPLRERLAEAESTEPWVYLVAESEDEIVGFVQLRYGECRPEHVAPDEAYLQSLYVDPDRWNEGVGSALLAASLDGLPSRVVRVRLGVLSANEPGKRFYERRGFERVDAGTVEVGGVAYDTDIYARELR
jgi:ribosomal protein S18 acetylase RimI-like enzyme